MRAVILTPDCSLRRKIRTIVAGPVLFCRGMKAQTASAASSGVKRCDGDSWTVRSSARVMLTPMRRCRRPTTIHLRFCAARGCAPAQEPQTRAAFPAATEWATGVAPLPYHFCRQALPRQNPPALPRLLFRNVIGGAQRQAHRHNVRADASALTG